MGATHPKGSTRPSVGAAVPLLIAAALLLTGCGNGGNGADSTSSAASTGSGSTAGAKAVKIVDYTYEPASIAVPVGTTVEFTNQDTTPHTATSKESGAFESGSIETGKTGSVKLEEAGTFAYYCVFHPFMKGTIVVR